MRLMRRGGAAEDDAATLGPGRVAVRVDVYALASEPGVPLGGRVSLDGVEIGCIERFSGAAKDGVRSFEFEVELAAPARRLRLESGDCDLRIARIVGREAPRAVLARLSA
jgi:hypothetical protein